MTKDNKNNGSQEDYFHRYPGERYKKVVVKDINAKK
jgi:hypothetical protein